jgi:hypothetical protein
MTQQNLALVCRYHGIRAGWKPAFTCRPQAEAERMANLAMRIWPERTYKAKPM